MANQAIGWILALALALAAGAGAASAQVVRCVDVRGAVTYSERGCADDARAARLKPHQPFEIRNEEGAQPRQRKTARAARPASAPAGAPGK